MNYPPRNIVEEHYLAEILNEVKQRTGVKTNKPLLPMVDSDPYTIGTNDVGIIYVPGISRLLNREQLGGVFAHELGHEVLHVGGSRRGPVIEFEADQFAAEHGYGIELASAIQTVNNRRLVIDDENSVTHPPDEERLRRLRQ